MKIVTRCLVSTVLAASVTTLLFAQVPALNIRMGLWEMTSNSSMSGDMPGMDPATMAKLTPAQQAQMAAMMKSMQQPQTTTAKSCLTKDKLNAQAFFGKEAQQDCKEVFKTNTASAIDVTVTCAGTNPSTSTIHVNALSPTSMQGSAKGSMTQNGKTMNYSSNFTSKWVGADCGTVK